MNHVVNATLIILGLFAMAVFPPLGLLMVVGGIVGARAHNSQIASERRARQARREQRDRRERILAFKAMP